MERVLPNVRGYLDSRKEKVLCDRIESAVVIKHNPSRQCDKFSESTDGGMTGVGWGSSL